MDRGSLRTAVFAVAYVSAGMMLGAMGHVPVVLPFLAMLVAVPWLIATRPDDPAAMVRPVFARIDGPDGVVIVSPDGMPREDVAALLAEAASKIRDHPNG